MAHVHSLCIATTVSCNDLLCRRKKSAKVSPGPRSRDGEPGTIVRAGALVSLHNVALSREKEIIDIASTYVVSICAERRTQS